jgi:hypothetical protein
MQEKLFSSDPDQGMKKYHLWLKDFQEYITAKGLETIVGKENISYQGRVDGFRQGDENGDSPILSHVFGELPVSLHTPHLASR